MVTKMSSYTTAKLQTFYLSFPLAIGKEALSQRNHDSTAGNHNLGRNLDRKVTLACRTRIPRLQYLHQTTSHTHTTMATNYEPSTRSPYRILIINTSN